MPVSEEYINKALGDLPKRRETNERAAKFMVGDIRNDDNPNDAFANKVIIKPKETT